MLFLVFVRWSWSAMWDCCSVPFYGFCAKQMCIDDYKYIHVYSAGMAGPCYNKYIPGGGSDTWQVELTQLPNVFEQLKIRIKATISHIVVCRSLTNITCSFSADLWYRIFIVVQLATQPVCHGYCVLLTIQHSLQICWRFFLRSTEFSSILQILNRNRDTISL